MGDRTLATPAAAGMVKPPTSAQLTEPLLKPPRLRWRLRALALVKRFQFKARTSLDSVLLKRNLTSSPPEGARRRGRRKEGGRLSSTMAIAAVAASTIITMEVPRLR